MQSFPIEAEYPINFRKDFAQKLGNHIKNHHSVNLIGMRRVGISNFLRFFLNHKEISKVYINDDKNHLFIAVDLNDLVERELYPFWVLVLKRIIDYSKESLLPNKVKGQLENIFLDCIQSKDLLLTIDGIKKSLNLIISSGFIPTLFLIRFDRLKDVVTPEFLFNLEGLKDATHNKLSFIFTAFRSLDNLDEERLNRVSLALVDNEIYLSIAEKSDLEIVYQGFKKHTKINFSPVLKNTLFNLVGGYIQYLNLALINIHQSDKKISSSTLLGKKLMEDDRIKLQSEELWESLNESEQKTLIKINRNEKVSKEDQQTNKYLWETGIINSNNMIFSSLFEGFLNSLVLEKSANGNLEFSKKEHTLFKYLKDNLDQICDRESIIESVWPEEEELGVSDWAIDRLISRVRSKLKLQESAFEILTIKTRGFKLAQRD